jgi:hypothetical protein
MCIHTYTPATKLITYQHKNLYGFEGEDLKGLHYLIMEEEVLQHTFHSPQNKLHNPITSLI